LLTPRFETDLESREGYGAFCKSGSVTLNHQIERRKQKT